MRRVIKFRGLDYKGNWQYGSYYVSCMYPISFTGHYVNDVLVDETTVGQFTGLHDDIDSEIYEGDLVQTMSRGTLIIEWNDDNCKFKFSDGADINDGENYGWSKLVVGNIHENPELINEAHKIRQ